MATSKDKKTQASGDANETADFESATSELANIIATLEDESTSLEQALAEFERGVKLTRSTQKILREAEQKVQMLLEADGEPVYRDVEDQE